MRYNVTLTRKTIKEQSQAKPKLPPRTTGAITYCCCAYEMGQPPPKCDSPSEGLNSHHEPSSTRGHVDKRAQQP